MRTPIIILHGWARDGKGTKYDALKAILEKRGYLVYLPDLPGFGKNPLKKEELFFEDYLSFVHHYVSEILQKTKKKKIILLGHSFGGRLGIKFTSLYPELIEALILTGASGIPRPLPSLKKKLVYGITKITRPIFIIPPFSIFYKVFRKLVYYSIGEMDYYKAGNLSQTFKNVYKVSIVEDLEKLSVPTLIVWGRRDTITPLFDGEYMHKHIHDSKFVIIPNVGHRLPYDNPQEFAREIFAFLQ